MARFFTLIPLHRTGKNSFHLNFIFMCMVLNLHMHLTKTFQVYGSLITERSISPWMSSNTFNNLFIEINDLSITFSCLNYQSSLFSRTCNYELNFNKKKAAAWIIFRISKPFLFFLFYVPHGCGILFCIEKAWSSNLWANNSFSIWHCAGPIRGRTFYTPNAKQFINGWESSNKAGFFAANNIFLFTKNTNCFVKLTWPLLCEERPSSHTFFRTMKKYKCPSIGRQ